MRQLSFCIPDAGDLPMVVARVMMNFGSLAANQYSWATLLRSLGCNQGLAFYHKLPSISLQEAAQRLILNARQAQLPAPEPIPGQAEITVHADAVHFVTPRGVLVCIGREEARCCIQMHFGRDSRRLAVNILATLFRFNVPGVARLLSQAAAEAALVEEEFLVA